MSTDIEIARAATLQPIGMIAEAAGIPDAALQPYGKHGGINRMAISDRS